MNEMKMFINFRRLFIPTLILLSALFSASAEKITLDFATNDYGLTRTSDSNYYDTEQTISVPGLDIQIELKTLTGSGFRLWKDGLRLYDGIISITVKSASFNILYVSYNLERIDGNGNSLNFCNRTRTTIKEFNISYKDIAEYRFTTEGAYIDKFPDNGSDIPSSVLDERGNRYPIIGISDKVFQNHTNLKTITLPRTLKHIGKQAFSGCTLLKSVAIPTSVVSIGSEAYSGCKALKSVTLSDSLKTLESGLFRGCTNLESIIIPNSVDSIGSEAFLGCAALKSATLSDSLKTLESGLFRGCTNLESIIIPNTVTTIGEDGFYGCVGLNSVIIPPCVTSIGVNAFSGCTGLIKCAYPSHLDNPFPSSANATCYSTDSYIDTDMVIYNQDYTTLCFASNSLSGNYTIPNSVKEIKSGAFFGCINLKSITLGSGMIKIGKDAFTYKDGNSYLKMDLDKAFWLGNTIPEGVEEVNAKINYVANNQYNFSNQRVYPFLSSKFEVDDIVYVPVSPSERTCDIVDYNYATEHENLIIAETVKNKNIELKICDINDFSFYNYGKCKKIETSNKGSIGIQAFVGCSDLQSVTLSNLGNIEEKAFYNCQGSFDLNVSNKGYIGSQAFAGCNEIKTINITSQGDIKTSAFEGCIGLKSVTLGNSGNIEGNAFYNCQGSFDLIASNNGYIGKKAFAECHEIKSLTINSKGDIKTSAFEDCSGIESATLSNIGKIEEKAFYNCSDMGSLLIGDEIPAIGESAFANCSSLPSVIIPDNVNTIGSAVFSKCSNLKSVTIGSGISELPVSTFSGCSSLPRISIPKTVANVRANVFSGCAALGDVTFEDYADDNSKVLSIASNSSKAAFADCALKNVYIGRDLSYSVSSNTGWSPFYNNKSLESVTFNDAETEITQNQFMNCSALKSVTMGSGITQIGNSAFEGCSDLPSFDMLDNVKTIGTSVFSDCSSLVDIDLSDKLESLPVYTFSNCSSLPEISIPGSVKSIGNNAFVGCTSLANVSIEDSHSDELSVVTLGSNGSSPLFADCPLGDVYIGRKLSYHAAAAYGYSPFYRNQYLKNVEITDAETEIYDNEFYGCTNLKTLKIGNGVTKIGKWAFSGCSSLDYFSAGYNVESIGEEAFSDCTGLTKYYSSSVIPPVCGNQALDDINKWECELYVPAESSDEYMAAPQWKEFFFISEMDAVLVAEIRLFANELELQAGESFEFLYQVFPANAACKQLVWTSSDPDVAIVNEDGVVTAIGKGETEITAESVDGNASASCMITVLAAAGADTIDSDMQYNVEVFTVNGVKIADSIKDLDHGIYIVKTGNKVVKIVK